MGTEKVRPQLTIFRDSDETGELVLEERRKSKGLKITYLLFFNFFTVLNFFIVKI